MSTREQARPAAARERQVHGGSGWGLVATLIQLFRPPRRIAVPGGRGVRGAGTPGDAAPAAARGAGRMRECPHALVWMTLADGKAEETHAHTRGEGTGRRGVALGAPERLSNDERQSRNVHR